MFSLFLNFSFVYTILDDINRFVQMSLSTGNKINALKALLRNTEFLFLFKEFLNNADSSLLSKADVNITKVRKPLSIILSLYFM